MALIFDHNKDYKFDGLEVNDILLKLCNVKKSWYLEFFWLYR